MNIEIDWSNWKFGFSVDDVTGVYTGKRAFYVDLYFGPVTVTWRKRL